jgi:3'(2'), 5'-bisphosphate nucleotidase
VIDPARLKGWLDAAAALARRAGEAILETVRDLGEVERKEDGSPVTRADRAAHRVIAAGLRSLTPELTVISEEGDVEGTVAAAGAVFWLVDPLDGTKEFIKGRPEYTVNVALVENGEAVLGAIHVPAANRLYVGARGLGARRTDQGGDVALAPGAVDRPRRAVVSRSHLTPETERLLERLGITERSSFGSSLKMCAVAEGAADVYPRLGPTCLWDTAAGTAIALAAGCAVVGLDGQPLRYDPGAGIKHPGFMVAAPGGCLDACRPAFVEIGASFRSE